MRDAALRAIPWPVRVIVGTIVHRKISATLYGQGTSRFSDDEILEFKREILETVNALLSESSAKSAGKTKGPFWALARGEPTEADATVFGALVSMVVADA
jgi:hypothetical protein